MVVYVLYVLLLCMELVPKWLPLPWVPVLPWKPSTGRWTSVPAPWIPSRSPVVHRPPVGTHRCRWAVGPHRWASGSHRWAGGPHRWIVVYHIGGQVDHIGGQDKVDRWTKARQPTASPHQCEA